MRDIENLLDFIVEIEKLKDIHRKTRPVGLERYENSAEHSWHVCVAALILQDYASEDVGIDRVIQMLLIHDLGEIDAGDTIIYASETKAIKSKEAAGIERLLQMLPEHKAAEYMALWYEFETGKTADSRYARAIDRVPPLLHNLFGDGHSWRAHNITKEKVLSLNSRIGEGSKKLWQVLEAKIEEAVSRGILK